MSMSSGVLRMIPEIIKEMSPVLTALASGLGGYFVAANKSRSQYREQELKFLEQARKDLQSNQEQAMESMRQLHEDDRKRLMGEINRLNERVNGLQSNLQTLGDQYRTEKNILTNALQQQEREKHDQVSQILELQTCNDKLLAQLKVQSEHVKFLENLVATGNLGERIAYNKEINESNPHQTVNNSLSNETTQLA